MVWEDPHAVLGVERGADRATVKRAWRDLALQFHPDKNPSPHASEQYHRIRQAAEQLLNKGTSQSAAQPQWQRQASTSQWAAVSRSSRFPMIFCTSCILGGFILFAGAVYVHQDLYTYNMHHEAEQRRQNPSFMQQRIMELLQEKRQQQRMEAAAIAQTAAPADAARR